jgi:hypothetical protein
MEFQELGENHLTPKDFPATSHSKDNIEGCEGDRTSFGGSGDGDGSQGALIAAAAARAVDLCVSLCPGRFPMKGEVLDMGSGSGDDDTGAGLRARLEVRCRSDWPLPSQSCRPSLAPTFPPTFDPLHFSLCPSLSLPLLIWMDR